MWEAIKKLELENWVDIINCIIAFVALFMGGSAHKKINKYKKSFNDKKKFGDNCVDNSKKSAGDMTVYEFDPNALAKLTSLNFETSLKVAYETFDKKAAQNIQEIIRKAELIVKENQLDLAEFTKKDWINIYFENAKNTSNVYMQEIWAKVLAIEIINPNSFSYKTLDVLRDMSEEDFHLFEKLCSICINKKYIFNSQITTSIINWSDQIKLCEMGLLNHDKTNAEYVINPEEIKIEIIKHEDFAVLVKNITNKTATLHFKIYTVSKVMLELIKVATYKINNEYILKCVQEINEIYKTSFEFIVCLIGNDNVRNEEA